MRDYRPNKLLLLLALGLCIRIFTIMYALGYRENTDILRWKDWGRIAYLYGVADTYKTHHLSFGTLPNNVPPGEGYLVSAVYQLNIVLTKGELRLFHEKPGSSAWVNGEQLTLLLRVPSLIADIFITIFIYRSIQSFGNKNRALFGSALFYLNPVVIYNGALWGQLDSVNNIFAIIAVYFLLKKKFVLPAMFLACSLFIKLSLIAYLPFFFLFMYVENKKKAIIAWMMAVIPIFLLTFPVSSSPFSWWYQFLRTNSVGEMQNITAFAFNFWWVVYHPWVSIGKPTTLFDFSEVRLIGSPDANITHLGIFSLATIAYGLFIFSLLPYILLIAKYKKKIVIPVNMVLMLAIAALCTFLLLPRMHERYLYPMFPLLALYIGLQKKFFIVFLLLSMVSTINLYLVWHPMPVFFFPYILMDNRFFQWIVSLCTLLTGGYFFMVSFKTIMSNEK